MLYDKELIAHKLLRWEKFIQAYNLPEWDALPDFGLYMEQVVTLLSHTLSFVPAPAEPRERLITASAVNNYVRLRLMPAPVKKRYFRVHIAYLIMIITLKQSLSIQDIQKAVPAELPPAEMEALYTDYAALFRNVALLFTQQARSAVQDVLRPESSSEAAVASLVVKGALVSGFARILAEKIVHLQGADTQEVLRLEQALPQTLS